MKELSEGARRVRDGLFLASSRTYAEQYVEPFIRAKYGFKEPISDDHDALGRDGKRYEIKACKVLRATDNGKGSKSIIERIWFEALNLETSRLVPFQEHLKGRGSNPSSWPAPPLNDVPTYLAELRLFTSAQPLPAPFVPADGALISESQYPDLRSLLGDSLPLIVAPDGYQWAVATSGIYPGNW